jgi:Putative peptidoglycan binding domain
VIKLVAIAGAGVVVAAVAIVFASGAFGGGSGGPAVTDNTYPISYARVEKRSLTSQTQVSATLGYAAPSTIVEPAGTMPTDLSQAQQSVTTGSAQLATAQAALTADAAALAQASSSLAADRAKLAVDCAGANAATAPAAAGGANGGNSGASPCASDSQAVATDQQNATQSSAKVAADRQQVSSARTALASAQQSLSGASASATVYGQGSTFTTLPPLGAIVTRGQELYGIGGQPVVLLYGSVAAWRAFVPGMPAGKDVAELNTNLRALGYGAGLAGNAFTSATAAAIDAFQSAHGLPRTGRLLLGSVVFEAGPIRVTSVTPTIGESVQSGPVLGITSTVRQVTIDLDAADQSSIKLGDRVTITLPDNSTTPGKVTYVGTVATVPSSSGNGGGGDNGDSSPTIEVDVTPTDPAATGRLDQAPVNVSIVTASVNDALVVPVDALLALASGGYAVEEVAADGTHHLTGANPGLFDDASGLVQVTGDGLAAGQRVVIPGT